MINVSKPYLPAIEEFLPYLTQIWSSGVATNNGPIVQEFEKKLREYTGAKHAFFVSNGTIALQLAIRAANIKGKILTTPFSAVATVSSILWEHYEPIFADIDPRTWNINASDVHRHITNETGAIIATHIYGNSCDIDTLEEIATRRGIPLIFDASHAFGSIYKGRDIMTYGTISTLSLHAYKILHSMEGGVIFTNDDAIAKEIYQMRHFGRDSNMDVKVVGINAKSSEMNAAVGICSLDHFDKVRQSRQSQSEYYDLLIAKSNLDLDRPSITPHSTFNFSYYAIAAHSVEDLKKIHSEFDKKGIQFRQLFFPSLNTLEFLQNHISMPISESIASRVLCLPLHMDLIPAEQEMIIDSIISATCR